MKILNFGSINIDNILEVDHIVKEGETISSKSYKKEVGGKGLNQSIALAKTYDKVYHAGMCGYDGDFLVEYLAKNGVNTQYIKKISEPTGNALIQVDKNGQNSIVLYPAANRKIDKTYIDHVLSNFGKEDIILLQNEISNISYIIERASDIGMYIILNPSPITEDIKKIPYEKIDLTILNETEAMDLTGAKNEKEAIELIGRDKKFKEAIVTLGAGGSYYLGEETIYQEAYKVKVVDTTGAGDTFTGYYIGMRAKGKAIPKALQIASKAASLAVGKEGASVSIPDLDEVLSI